MEGASLAAADQQYQLCAHLVIDDNIVLCSHVICNVVVHNESQQPVEQSQVDLFIHLVKVGLHHYVALSLRSLPHILQVVDA